MPRFAQHDEGGFVTPALWTRFVILSAAKNLRPERAKGKSCLQRESGIE